MFKASLDGTLGQSDLVIDLQVGTWSSLGILLIKKQQINKQQQQQNSRFMKVGKTDESDRVMREQKS